MKKPEVPATRHMLDRAHAGATILIAQHVGDDLRGVPLVPSTYCFPSGLWLCSASQAAQGLLARSDLLLEDCL